MPSSKWSSSVSGGSSTGGESSVTRCLVHTNSRAGTCQRGARGCRRVQARARGRTRVHAGACGCTRAAEAACQRKTTALPFDRKWRTQGCQSRRGAPTSIHFVQRRSLGGRSRPRCAACVQGPEGRRYRQASTTGGESEGRPRSHTEELTGREPSRRDAHRRALSPCQLARPVQATLDSAAT